MTVLEAFGRRLRELRKENGMNQIQLAEKLGVSRGSISFYENADRMPDLNLLERAAEFFDVTIDYLLGRDDSDAERMKRERDAAIADLDSLRIRSKWPCEACYYTEHYRRDICLGCGYNDYSNWQWRGAKMDEEDRV